MPCPIATSREISSVPKLDPTTVTLTDPVVGTFIERMLDISPAFALKAVVSHEMAALVTVK